MTDLRPIIAARIGRGSGQITQTAAAKLADLPRPTVSAWLAGKRALSCGGQVRLAAAVGLVVRVVVEPIPAA